MLPLAVCQNLHRPCIALARQASAFLGSCSILELRGASCPNAHACPCSMKKAVRLVPVVPLQESQREPVQQEFQPFPLPLRFPAFPPVLHVHQKCHSKYCLTRYLRRIRCRRFAFNSLLLILHTRLLRRLVTQLPASLSSAKASHVSAFPPLHPETFPALPQTHAAFCLHPVSFRGRMECSCFLLNRLAFVDGS